VEECGDGGDGEEGVSGSMGAAVGLEWTYVAKHKMHDVTTYLHCVTVKNGLKQRQGLLCCVLFDAVIRSVVTQNTSSTCSIAKLP
jgi:hypothetical protein